MRDLRTLNLVGNPRNLRLFDVQHRIISHQRSGLFGRVSFERAYGKRIYVKHMRGVWYACTGSRVCARQVLHTAYAPEI